MKNCLVFTFAIFSLFIYAEDWMPDGMIVDKSGNVIHVVEMPNDFRGPKKTLTTLAYIAEIEKGQTIVNLSKNAAFKVDAEYDENSPPPNDGSGFMVTKFFKVADTTLPKDFVEGRGTFRVGTNLLPLSAGPQLGVMIEIGGGMVGELFAKTHADIQKLPKFAIVPYNLKILKKYKIGDSLTYSVKGGLGLMVGVGAAAKIWKIGAEASVNIGMIGEGTWICNVKKTGPNSVQARYVKQKLKKLIAYGRAGAVIINAQAEINKYDGAGVGTFFEFNLADPLGMKAYKKFLMGNVIPAQQLAAKVKVANAFRSNQKGIGKFARKMMVSPVRPLMTYKSKISGHEKKIKFDIPVLVGLRAKRGKNMVISETKMAGSNLTVKTHLGVFKDERETFGVLKRSNYRLAMFTGTYQRLFKHTPTGESLFSNRYSANYKYQYHSEKLLEGELEEEIMNMVEKIGFKGKLKDLKIRQAAVDVRKYLQWRGKDVKFKGKKIALSKKSKKKVLGSIKISADLMIGMEAIKELINKAIYRGEKWKNLAVKHVDIWFENPNNKRWELCPVIKKGMKSSMGRSFCKMKVVRSTKKGMELAYKSLVKMQGNIAKHDYKKFVENFADFGNGFSVNQFTFNSVLDLVEKGDVHLVIQWQGERIPQGELVLIKSKRVKFDGLNRKKR